MATRPSQESSGALVSRRAFLARGAAVFAGCLAAGSLPAALSGCSSSSDDSAVDVLSVDDSAVTTLDAFTEIKKPSRYYALSELATLDDGTQIFSTDNKIGACLCTGATASPLSTVELIDLSTGTVSEVLKKGVLDSRGYSIYAACTSSDLLVWVEDNYLTSDWAVYCATVDASSLSIGDAVKLDEGTGDYDAPEISVIGQTAYWIVQPAESGSKTSDDSYLKASAGGSAASVLITSHGRFCEGLSVSEDILTCMPRADTSSGVYYTLTAIQSGTGSVVATLTMPHSFKPLCAIYVGGAFSFGIKASYDYGGGIANVGTYYPLSSTEWLRIAKEPVTALSTCKGWLCCKSGSRTVFIDPDKRRYFTVSSPSDATSYGDYPATVGAVSRVYNYSTINKTSGSKEVSSVLLRSIAPVDIS
ncbi:MAG: hypothetical protein ACOX69_01115 [Coriobacteriales bacterium]|jgi:hypothetical protein